MLIQLLCCCQLQPTTPQPEQLMGSNFLQGGPARRIPTPRDSMLHEKSRQSLRKAPRVHPCWHSRPSSVSDRTRKQQWSWHQMLQDRSWGI